MWIERHFELQHQLRILGPDGRDKIGKPCHRHDLWNADPHDAGIFLAVSDVEPDIRHEIDGPLSIGDQFTTFSG